ncbi:hypothetical protein [Cystobacter fuscus]|uniref:hypothetical protein n=1 Tax=Cystobacter fuscus TaxID=43 RepID=UPI002B28F095|nr:hypothetical protein F0U63_05095 [Cystobacter fuscus]
MTGTIRSGPPLPATPALTRARSAPELRNTATGPRTPARSQSLPPQSAPQPKDASSESNRPAEIPARAAPEKPAVQDNSKLPVDQRLTAAALDSVGNPYSILLDTPNNSGPLEFKGDRLTLMDHDVLVAPMGEYKMALDPSGTKKKTYGVGSASQPIPGRMEFKGTGAGATHTQGDGTPGIHHQQVNGYASLARVRHEQTHQHGKLSAKTTLDAAPFHAEGSASLRLNTNKGQKQAIAYVGGKALVGAHATAVGHVGTKHASVVGRADLRAGAFLEGETGVVMDRQRGDFFVQARVVSLAGIEAKSQAQAQLGPFIAYGGISAKAGVGYEFGVGAGMKDGVIKAQANMGAAFAVGGTSFAGVGFDTNWVRQRKQEHRLRKQERQQARLDGEPRPRRMPHWARSRRSEASAQQPATTAQKPAEQSAPGPT